MGSRSISEDNATLPSIVDERAHTDPDRLYGASTWIGDDGKFKLRKITYHDLADAVNRCAQWLDTRFRKSTDFTTLAYAGNADYRYLIVTMAAAKTGHKALLLAPWNPPVAQLKLLEECNCSIFLAAEDSSMVQREMKAITMQRTMQTHQFPTLDWLLDGPDAPFYPFDKTLDEVREQDYVIIHTSGSTGHPSPMTYKYGALAALKSLEQPVSLDGPSPGPFNTYWNMPMILSPGDRPITADIAAQIFSEDVCEAAFIPPAYLHALSRDPSQLETIRKLKHVLWVGAPWTSSETADAIRARAEIQPAYGSSEAGPFAMILGDQEDYAWTHFHPVMGATLRHFSEGLHELVLEKDSKTEKAQFVFQNFPHLAEWATKDLFSRHPTRDDLWRFRGRKDDITVLANGRNIEPGLMEGSVAAHPKVKAALLCGSGKTMTSLLVEATEPLGSAEESARLVQEIWPIVESANEVINAHGRIQKPLILFATKGKPFMRAGKGSVQRSTTVKAYEQELEELFRAAEKDLEES